MVRRTNMKGSGKKITKKAGAKLPEPVEKMDEDAFQDESNEQSSAFESEESVTAPKRRGGGRPKGSSQSSTFESEESEPAPERRRRGRPKASTKRSSESSQSEDEPLEKKMKTLKLRETFDSLPCGVTLCLGQGEFGQLGLGEDTTTRKKPALVLRDLEGKNVKKVIAGGMHTVCLTDEHQVFTFGCNDEGSLGRTTSDDSEEFEPGLVTGALKGVKVVDISAGDSHSAALSEEGTVYVWGSFRDSHGKLGLLKPFEGSKVPIKLQSLRHPVIKIVSGSDHIAMLTSNGQVYTIGCAEQGQLGRIGRYFTDRGGRRCAQICLMPKPIALPKIRKNKPVASDVFCGIYTTYVISNTGDVFGFGLNNYYQLGITDEECRYQPEYVPALSNKHWKMMAGGPHHLLLLDQQGNVYSLGRGEYGRLGLGEDVKIVDHPTRVSGLKDIALVSTGQEVSFAVGKNGKAYGWGMGTNLQLTTGEEEDEWTPVELSGKNLEERSVIAVDGGGQHTVILACDRSKFVNGKTS